MAPRCKVKDAEKNLLKNNPYMFKNTFKCPAPNLKVPLMLLF